MHSQFDRPARRNDQPEAWTLDLILVSLAGLALYLVVTRLRFDDPSWIYNAMTYVVGIPTVALITAIGLRSVASRFIHKSVQIGLLFSIVVHLMLLVAAVNLVVFSSYYHNQLAATQPQRPKKQHTVPEHIFHARPSVAAVPDWAQPVAAETASRVIPKEERLLAPQERAAPRLQIPQRREPLSHDEPYQLNRAERTNEPAPKPTDDPAKLARRMPSSERIKSAPEDVSRPTVPTTSAKKRRSEPETTERMDSELARIAPGRRARPELSTSRTEASPNPSTEPGSARRHQDVSQPRVGEFGARQRRRGDAIKSMPPAGASPARSVAVAAITEQSDRVLSPVELPKTERGATPGARIKPGDDSAVSLYDMSDNTDVGVPSESNALPRAGIPDIKLGSDRRTGGRRAQRRSKSVGGAIMRGPQSIVIAESPTEATEDGGASNVPMDRVADTDIAAQLRSDQTVPMAEGQSAAMPDDVVLDLMADFGTPGLGNRANNQSGVVSPDEPSVDALAFLSRSRRRRSVGGPSTPVGSEIAAVESFSRRIMRTRDGTAPSGASAVGIETEEAIERGLVYLASIQKEDGSWSLKGPGENVALQSHTAATGLCLLAFQGAGYTHKEHRYADTVARGLQFLMRSQTSSGNLYRSEDTTSNQNVALYSHGIAALAICEAFGMTQDDELLEPAQLSIRYITVSQNTSLGGWRYTPGTSSDTSVTGWMMMALKSGELAGLDVSRATYEGIDRWLGLAQQSLSRQDRYRYNPFAPDTPTQRHGKVPTPTMTSVGMLMRMYSGWRRDHPAMISAADYLLKYPPEMGTQRTPRRDAYYWYYATQVMFHMGGSYWQRWSQKLNPLLTDAQIKDGNQAGSWDPENPIADRWSAHGGRLYVTTMNLLNLEIYYRHLPIYEDTAQ